MKVQIEQKDLVKLVTKAARAAASTSTFLRCRECI